MGQWAVIAATAGHVMDEVNSVAETAVSFTGTESMYEDNDWQVNGEYGDD